MPQSLYSEVERVGLDVFTATGYRPGSVFHIVLFRFADSVTVGERADAVASFYALGLSKRDGHPYIESISSGAQLSEEDGSNNFEYGFVVRFRSLGDRNYYVGEPFVSDPKYYDPQHAAYKREVGPLLNIENGVQVFDFIDAS